MEKRRRQGWPVGGLVGWPPTAIATIPYTLKVLGSYVVKADR